MANRARVFLDTSALFAGIWSAEGGARMLFKLGEVEAVQLLVSPQVLTEAEGVVRRKAPESLGLLAMLLDRSKIEVAQAPSHETVNKALALTDHQGDAEVLAAALSAHIDFFVTLDKAHFLGNSALKSATEFPVGTPGDCLAWLREQFSPDVVIYSVRPI
jgi:predicted nucleic acid-binding protein